MYISNNLKEFYGFSKNWFTRVDYNYYLKTIHLSTIQSLVDSIAFFRRGGIGSLDLKYLLKSNKNTWQKFIGSTVTVHRCDKGKPLTAITIGGFLDSEEFKISDITSLTSRELEIAQLITSGLAVSDIASKLKLSEHTITTHRKKIYKKLNVHNVSQLNKIITNV